MYENVKCFLKISFLHCHYFLPWVKHLVSSFSSLVIYENVKMFHLYTHKIENNLEKKIYLFTGIVMNQNVCLKQIATV